MTRPIDDPPDVPDPLAAWLEPLADAPGPDPAFLAGLRERSTHAFADAGPRTEPKPTRRRRMTRLVFAALAASLAAVGVALWQTPGPDPTPTLAAAVDPHLFISDTRFDLTRGGETSPVMLRSPRQLRRDDGPGRYTIVLADRAYDIDEAENRAKSRPAAEFATDSGGLDLFALAGLPRPDGRRLAETHPAAPGLYRLEVATPDGPREVEISADPGTNRFRELRSYAVAAGARVLLATLTLNTNDDKPMPPESFAVKPTLSEDGRVGTVRAVQGVAALKPANAERFSPLGGAVAVKPNDLLRTDPRGANAVTLQLMPSAAAIVGPGSTLEVTKPTKLRLTQGEVELTPAAGQPIELAGPGVGKDAQTLSIDKLTLVRIAGGKLAVIEQQPLWLQGLKGLTGNESLGALVATVDGRAVPLSIGYHRVSVEIRDQIARTTIDESFVNATDANLEGTFRFPLPADASIAGFAMSVGNELVEADVVEKQRAREIYETILREKRDPGLLEWAGGNVFQARVWPITPHAEKRIRITYTQVLPALGTSYRYSYPLVSEMTRTNPVRELSITVTVSSAVKLSAISSPTHPTRTQLSGSAGKLEFAAQQYTPTRDFEAVIERAEAPPVVVIPHRRGNDGYFLAQVTPPAGQAAERNVLGAGGLVSLVLLCDTSASIDPRSRTTQAGLVAAILGTLTPKDRFTLVMADAEAVSAFDKLTAATPEAIETARSALAARASLGWSNLDLAFDAAFKLCEPGTNVVYLGDGTPTTGDANPQSFSRRLQERYAAAAVKPVVHAVALGSTGESTVLAAIGALGSGSTRRVTAEQGPGMVALELMREVTSPPVRNVKAEFRGFQTARVYPEVLANLVPGTQQVILGRYKPTGDEQSGEVVITGLQNGQPVSYVAPVSLKGASEGNSFLPRLWARQHLDALLAQPQTSAVRDEVIDLSEEFHIMTPYTSFLVLESDADRVRFAVKRRTEMRDGERFFADGKAAARFELARQQVQLARDWRTNLQRQALARLEALGRANPADPRQQLYYARRRGDVQQQQLGSYDSGDVFFADVDRKSIDSILVEFTDGGFGGEYGAGLDEVTRKKLAKAEPAFDGKDAAMPEPASAPASPSPFPVDRSDREEVVNGRLAAAKSRVRVVHGLNLGLAATAFDGDMPALVTNGTFFGWDKAGSDQINAYSVPLVGRSSGYAGRPFRDLFVTVPAAPARPTPLPAGASGWPKEASELAALLDRRAAFAALKTPLKIDATVTGFEKGTATDRRRTGELLTPTRWLIRTESDVSASSVQWCDDKFRHIVDGSTGLGHRRTSTETDRLYPPREDHDRSLGNLEVAYYQWKAKVLTENGETVLVMTRPDGEDEVRYTIDRAKKAVTKSEQRDKQGKVFSTATYSEFVEVGGLWFAQRREVTADGKRTALMTRAVSALTAEEFARQVDAAAATQANALVLTGAPKTLTEARKALAAKTAGVDELVTLLDLAAALQFWPRAVELMARLDAAAATKPGRQWLRLKLEEASRRNDEARVRLLGVAADLLNQPQGGNRVALAGSLMVHAAYILSQPEQLALHDRLTPIFDALPVGTPAAHQWAQRRLNLLESTGRVAEALAGYRNLLADHPDDANLAYQYAQRLWNAGRTDTALQFVRERIARKEAGYVDNLRGLELDWLDELGRYAEMLKAAQTWRAAEPNAVAPVLAELSATARGGDFDAVLKQVTEWLAEAASDKKLTPADAARIDAAIGFALGQARGIAPQELDPRWHAPLAALVRKRVFEPESWPRVTRILGTGTFRNAAAAQELLTELTERFAAEADRLPEDVLIARAQGWSNFGPSAPPQTWVKLINALKARWETASNANNRRALGQSIVGLLQQKVGLPEAAAFARRVVETAPADEKAQARRVLLSLLVQQPWNPGVADEAFALVPQLGEPNDPAGSIREQAGQVQQLADWFLAKRQEALNAELARPDLLTRQAIAAKRQGFKEQAISELVERLKGLEKSYPATLKGWATVERQYWTIRRGVELDAVEAELWAVLGDAPKPRPKDDAAANFDPLATARESRTLAMALYLAARGSAKPAAAARMRAYLDKSIAQEPENAARQETLFAFLVARDLPGELDAVLQAFAKAGDPDGQWAEARARLLAELGRLPEAITLYEGLDDLDPAAAARQLQLAKWQQAVGDRAKSDAATRAAYRRLGEQGLLAFLNQKLAPWQRGGPSRPTELDPEVLSAFAAYFELSPAPEQGLYVLRAFADASKDFRLLAPLPDAVVGRSAGAVYNTLAVLLPTLESSLQEANFDEMLARLAEVRKRPLTPLDRRALDLIELQIQVRMSAVQNQRGFRLNLALAALKRAEAATLADGEAAAMGRFLRGLSLGGYQALHGEQERQLRGLHDRVKPGTPDRLQLADDLAVTLNNHGKAAEAIALLTAGIAEFTAPTGGKLRPDAYAAVSDLQSFETGRGRFDLAEATLQRYAKLAESPDQEPWFRQQLDGLYNYALASDKKVSLGEKDALFVALLARFREDLAKKNRRELGERLGQLHQLFRVGHDRGYASAPAAFAAFVKNDLPGLLPLAGDYQGQVQSFTGLVKTFQGKEAALDFLVTRYEARPAWRRYADDRAWDQFGSALLNLNAQLPTLAPPLSARLLNVARDELRRHLAAEESHAMYLFSHRYLHYWKEKEPEFVAVAEEVLKGATPARAFRVAIYLYHDANRGGRAIEVLQSLDAARTLPKGQRPLLARWLVDAKRDREAIPLLVDYLAGEEADLEARALLGLAYSHAGQAAELAANFARGEALIRAAKGDHGRELARLAEHANEVKLAADAVRIYGELIPNRQRSLTSSQDSELSVYYQGLALALSRQGKSAEAVDAASGGIIAWGSAYRNQQEALARLKQVVQDAPDLDAVARHLDAEAARSKLENPVVRLAVGKAYHERQSYAKAIAQLQLAYAAQPNDAETLSLLIESHDKENRKADATALLLAAAQAGVQSLDRFAELGKRYADAGQAALAERAVTSLVEIRPQEGEGYRRLAQVRQAQGRAADAVALWEQATVKEAFNVDNFLGLMAAQTEAKAFDAAAKTLGVLKSKAWLAPNGQQVSNVSGRIDAAAEELERRRKP